MVASHVSRAATNIPRLIAGLGLIAVIPTAISILLLDMGVSVIIPLAAVLGIGLYNSGTKQYEVLADRIRIAGVLGNRDWPFSQLTGFELNPTQTPFNGLQCLLVGSPPESRVEAVSPTSTFWSGRKLMWVEDAPEFTAAAQAALEAWRSSTRR